MAIEVTWFSESSAMLFEQGTACLISSQITLVTSCIHAMLHGDIIPA